MTIRVLHALENRGNHIPAIIAIGTGQRAQITKQPIALLAVRQRRFLIIDEGQKFIARDAVRHGSPIPPPIRRFDSRLEFLPSQLGLPLPLNFQVIQEFQEHDPSEHRQPVQIPVQTFIFSHNVPGRLEKRSKGLCSSGLHGKAKG